MGRQPLKASTLHATGNFNMTSPRYQCVMHRMWLTQPCSHCPLASPDAPSCLLLPESSSSCSASLRAWTLSKAESSVQARVQGRRGLEGPPSSLLTCKRRCLGSGRPPLPTGGRPQCSMPRLLPESKARSWGSSAIKRLRRLQRSKPLSREVGTVRGSGSLGVLFQDPLVPES